jgi:O-antigen biosynthesis protein
MVVHVILPAFQPNQKWLAAQLNSILAQSSVTVRIWFCPDGPDEASETVLGTVDDERVTTLSFEQQVGVVANVERALRSALEASAPGDLFAFSDQDDIWHSEKLTKGIAALPSNSIAASAHDARVVDSTGALLASSLNAYEGRHTYSDQLALLIANSISGMTLLTTRDAIERSLPFPDSLPGMFHDWWLGLVISGTGRIARIDDTLVDYRQHDRNVIGARAAPGKALISPRAKRPFLGQRYRNIATSFFEARREIACVLAARGALAAPAEDFFLNRKLGAAVRLWRGNARRYAVRCAAGMLLSG